MNWTRRWGIIGSIALAQLGIIVGYQALLTEGTSAANAGQVPTPKTVEAPSLPPPGLVGGGDLPAGQGLPPIALPPMPEMGMSPTPPPHPGPVPPIYPGPVIPAVATEPPQPVPPAPLPSLAEGAQKPPNEFDLLKANRAGAPAVNPIAPAPTATVAGSPWNLSVEIIGGRTRLTARNGDDVKFSVSCEKLDVQSPKGRIEASGKVQVTSDNLDGTCDRLTISWEEEVVVLDKVQLKCKLQGQAAEVNAEQLRLRLDHIVAAKEKLWPPQEK